MYLYNVSIIMEESIHDPLVSWLKEEFATSLQAQMNLLYLLDSPHEGHTYCLQLTSPDLATIKHFKQNNLVHLQAYLTDNYTDKAFLFDTTMKYV